MLKYLLIGDSHVPKRASELPIQIQSTLEELANSELFEYTFFTGDEIHYPDFMRLLNSMTKKDVLRVIGNMDYYYGNRDPPVYQKLALEFPDNEHIIIGLTHGSQIHPRGDKTQLEQLAIDNNYTILVSGHTHKEEVFLTKNGRLLLNPGSVTGAWSFVASGIPSFMVLKIDNETKEIEVDLYQFNKKSKEMDEIKSFFVLKRHIIKPKY